MEKNRKKPRPKMKSEPLKDFKDFPSAPAPVKPKEEDVFAYHPRPIDPIGIWTDAYIIAAKRFRAVKLLISLKNRGVKITVVDGKFAASSRPDNDEKALLVALRDEVVSILGGEPATPGSPPFSYDDEVS